MDNEIKLVKAGREMVNVEASIAEEFENMFESLRCYAKLMDYQLWTVFENYNSNNEPELSIYFRNSEGQNLFRLDLEMHQDRFVYRTGIKIYHENLQDSFHEKYGKLRYVISEGNIVEPLHKLQELL